MSDLIRREDALRVTLAYSSSYSAEQAETAIRALPVAQPDARAEAAEADAARLREERGAILSDSIIHSDQREKYERLCARIAAGKASQQDAVDAIRQLCRDNERLALRLSDARAAMTGQQP